MYKEKNLTMKTESVILKVGDLIRVKHTDYSPFYDRPEVGEIGIIIEIYYSTFLGVVYFIQTRDGICRFSDYEVELIDESR